MKRKRQREPCTQGSKARSRACGSNPPLPSILAKTCISHTQAMQACVLSKRLHSLICPKNQVLPFQALVLATIRSSGLLTAGFNDSSSITKDQSHYLGLSSFVLSHIKGKNINNICSRTCFYNLLHFCS